MPAGRPPTESTKRDHKLRYYRDKAQEYRWQLKAPNGEIIAASTEGYKYKHGAMDNFSDIRHVIASNAYRIVDET